MPLPTQVSSVPPTVLVVDDETIVIDVLTRLLPRIGLTVVSATTAAQAGQLLATQAFGCLLTDKNLPDEDGFAVMRAARKLQPYCACIMMTGYSSTATAVEALRLGASDYLEKPFDDLNLVGEKISRAIRNQQSEFERNRLVEQLKSFQAELDQRDARIASAQTEIGLFNRILEARVAQATKDLRAERERLEEMLENGKCVDDVLVSAMNSIVEDLRAVELNDGEPMARARAVITRVLRRLEEHLRFVQRELDKALPPKAR